MLQPGGAVVVNVAFAPTADGSYSSTMEVDSNGGNIVVAVTGAPSPPVMSISTTSLDYGSVPLGSTASESFTVSNTGGEDLTITKSKPPVTGPFSATTALAEGTTLAPGSSLTETVDFTPTTLGSVADTWSINGDDGLGVRTISFTGAGIIPPTWHGYWLVGSDGGIFSFGSAQFYGSMGGVALQRPVVGIVAAQGDDGYWLDASDGGVLQLRHPVLWFDPRSWAQPCGFGTAEQPQRPDRGNGALQLTMAATSWWPRTAGSLPLVTHASRGLARASGAVPVRRLR